VPGLFLENKSGTFDAQSESGVLLVITTVTNDGTDIEFSLRATGVHP